MRIQWRRAQRARVLRGDRRVVQARREEAAARSRSRAAVQAALDKLVPLQATAPVAAEALTVRDGVLEIGSWEPPASISYPA